MLGGESLLPVRTRLVRRGDVLAGAGGAVTTVYAVLSGRVGLFEPAAGRLQLRQVLGPGSRAGEVEVLSEGHTAAPGIQCLTAGVVAVVPADCLQEWYAHPEVAVYMLNELAREIRALERRRIQWAQLDATGRLAALVLELHDCFDTTEHQGSRRVATVPHGLSQAHIGDLVGARRETVNRSVRILEDEGLLSTRGRGFILHNLEGLILRAGAAAGARTGDFDVPQVRAVS